MTGILMATLGVLVWRRRPAAGATEFVLFAVAVADWSLASALEYALADLPGKIVAAKIEYIGIVSVPPLWLACMLAYTGVSRGRSRARLALGIVPLLTLALTFTNEWHGLIWRKVDLVLDRGITMWTAEYGPWFWVHSAYSYLVVAAATLVVIGLLQRSANVYRGQAALLLVGIAIPCAANATYISGHSPLPYVDLTPFGFALGGLAVGTSLFRFGLFDIVPVARAKLLESLDEAVIVVDSRRRVVELNPAAAHLLGRSTRRLLGHPAADIQREQPALWSSVGEVSEADLQLGRDNGSPQRYYEVRRSALVGAPGETLGWVIVVRDITDRKLVEEQRLQRERDQVAQAAAAVAQQRSEFMVRATERLSQSLDLATIAASLAELIVPTLADWCAVDVVEDHRLQRLALAGEADDVSVDLVASAPLEPERLRAVLETRLEHRPVAPQDARCHIVPLVAHGHLLGGITLLKSGRAGAQGIDVGMADELAGRAALAIDNAQLYGEAQRAIRFRDEFLSIAAHELRTPMTALSGYVQLLSRHPNLTADSAKLQSALGQIRKASDRLARSIAELLDMTRLERGKFVLERQEVNLTTLIRDEVQMAQAGTQRHTLVLDAPSQVSAVVDPLRIEQLITNLLQNAIRYSPDGGEIEVGLCELEPGLAQLSVRDHGIGVGLEQRDHIFERFYQVSSHPTAGGLGLGLYLCRNIVEQHGGTIRLEAPSDGGSRFVVVLPRDAS
ncbi:MAG TPA: histidine kinase N-terminal 7TM domain-containing protein [Chloroflexota bacterium]